MGPRYNYAWYNELSIRGIVIYIVREMRGLVTFKISSELGGRVGDSESP